MTWYEKLKKEKHSTTPEVIRAIDCPADTQRTQRCPDELEAETQTLLCEKCWNRQVPEDWTGRAASYTPPAEEGEQ